MPLWLRIIGVELECGFPLEKALESACDGEGGFSKDLREALSEVDRGKSFPQAMKSLSEKSESKFFKRFCQQLALFSEEGKGSESISKLAEEVSENQKNKARVHSAQLSFLSLFFMAIGCILPSLLAAYVIAGSAFLETHFSTEFVFLAFVVAFPLADSAILLYLREKTPKMVSG
jgi:type II secretory pathway component PulF